MYSTNNKIKEIVSIVSTLLAAMLFYSKYLDGFAFITFTMIVAFGCNFRISAQERFVELEKN